LVARMQPQLPEARELQAWKTSGCEKRNYQGDIGAVEPKTAIVKDQVGTSGESATRFEGKIGRTEGEKKRSFICQGKALERERKYNCLEPVMLTGNILRTVITWTFVDKNRSKFSKHSPVRRGGFQKGRGGDYPPKENEP